MNIASSDLTNPIREVEYSSCDGQMRVRCFMYKNEKWWCVSSPGHPDRWVKLHNDGAIAPFVKSYAYIDQKGCVNSVVGRYLTGAPISLTSNRTLDGLNATQRATTGIPQRVHNSGLCWYCAMCFVMFFPKQMRDLLFAKGTPEFRAMSQGVLNNPTAAEKLRRFLYNRYALGDVPDQHPELDGQNGFSQMCILMAHFDIPIIRLFGPKHYEIKDSITDQRGNRLNLRSNPREGEASLLAVRCFRTKWMPKRRLTHNGRRYKLIALLIGSEHCGHQIAASTCDLRICRWAVSDSDATQRGIGPMFWSIHQKPGESRESFKRQWQQMWEHLIPVTIFGRSEMCDLNPTNRPTHELEKYAKIVGQNSKPGVVNTDYIYINE